ncbi:ATP-dependent zinc protease [Orbus wheelerorum]|uniref:ATP-dependent zinc protease family protein n=1 Tax=Orbus wheelerorum TaxID=3074111 RepID=UPI00370DA74E
MRLSIFLSTGLFLLVIGMLNAQAKNIFGLYEKVQLPEIGSQVIKAKLDTGALTSSFGATDIHFFEKDGKEWVRFKPQIAGKAPKTIEKPIVRYSKIKTRSDDLRDDEDNSHSKRPVVVINICFDGTLYPTEVNLTDRSRFNYPLLLGSSALVQFKAIVDPSVKYQSKTTQCKL